MPAPTVKVEVAFTSSPDDPVQVWEDITDYVDMDAGVTYSRGRSNEISDFCVEPGTGSLRLFNDDGRFTMGNASSPYHPVKPFRRIRVLAKAATPLDGHWLMDGEHQLDALGSFVPRFDGTVDQWPVAFDGRNAVSEITFTERNARLGFTRKLRSYIQEEILKDRPYAYFPLGDTGAEFLGNIADVPRFELEPEQVGSGGEVSIGGGTGPAADGAAATTFSPDDSSNGIYLRETAVSGVGPTSRGIEAFFRTDNATFGTQRIAELRQDLINSSFRLYVNASGKLCAKADSAFSTAYTITGTTSVGTATHHAAVVETVSAGTVTARLYLDGVEEGSATYPAVFGAFVIGFDRMNVGGCAAGELFTGTISHVASYSGTVAAPPSATRLADRYPAGMEGFAGESSDSIIEKLLGYLGIDSGDFDLEAGSANCDFRDPTDSTIAEVASDLMDVEGGVLFCAADGTYTMHARQHRHQSTTQLTLDVDDGDVEADFRATGDTQFLVNDRTVRRANGAYQRTVNQESIDDYGRFLRDSVTSFAASDDAAARANRFYVGRFSDPTIMRCPSVSVDVLTNRAQAVAAMGCDISARIDVVNLPAAMGADSLSFFVEGVSETISTTQHTITFLTSPNTWGDVWVLGDPVLSRLGVTTVLAY